MLNKLYQIPVQIRTIGGYTMESVIRTGRLMALDGIGFYLCGDMNPDDHDTIRSCMTNAMEGSIVVRARSVFEAVNTLYTSFAHPGWVGLGTERRDKKAVWREPRSYGSTITELPNCELDSVFDGACFQTNEHGWATCKYVAGMPENQEPGYCRCFLQGAREANTGCLVEAYYERAILELEPTTDDAGIRYVPYVRDLYREVIRAG